MAPFKIIVGTCKAYESVAQLWHRAATRYWPEAAATATICSDQALNLPKSTIDRVFAHAGDWCERLVACLQVCEDEFVVFILDDYILEAPMPHANLVVLANRMKAENDIGVIYLTDTGLNAKGVARKGLFDITRGPYSINSCPGLWRRTFLIETLKSFKDPWAWEAFAFGTAVAGQYRATCWAPSLYTYSFGTGGLIYRGSVSRVALARISPREVLGVDLSDLPGFALEQDGAVAKRSLSWKLRFLISGFVVSPMAAWTLLWTELIARLAGQKRSKE